MAEQTHAQRTRRSDASAETAEVEQSGHAKEARDKLSDVDELLDEIDGILEGQEEMALQYRQVGGQ
jgi:hypothetical protein